MQPKPHKPPLGKQGEILGCRYLEQKGFRILATNYCNTKGKRLGEIDIIAKQDGYIVFVEVKTRVVPFSQQGQVIPEENITRQKLARLNRISQHYLRATRQEDTPYRFDALAISYTQNNDEPIIKHLEYIFF